MELRLLSAEDVRQALPMAVAIEAMKDAFAQSSAGKATVPLHSRIDLPSREAVSLFMPAHLRESDDLAIKIVSVFPHNLEMGVPTIHALVAVLDVAVASRALARAAEAGLGQTIRL